MMIPCNLEYEDQTNYQFGGGRTVAEAEKQPAFARRRVVLVLVVARATPQLFLFPLPRRRRPRHQATMKLSSLLPLIAASPLFAAAYADDYDSDAAKAAPSTPTLTALTESTTSQAATSTPSSSPWFDWTRLVTSGPIHYLLTRAGVNITQHLDAVAQRTNEKPWDSRIPMITDENWENMVLSEPLSPEEENDRTWFMVVCVPRFLVTTFNMLIMLL